MSLTRDELRGVEKGLPGDIMKRRSDKEKREWGREWKGCLRGKSYVGDRAFKRNGDQ